MPAASRKTDHTLCLIVDIEGNITQQIRTIVQGAGSVSTNNLPSAYLGHLTDHPCNIASGSGSVSIEGSPAARTGDAVSCGGVIIEGSPNVTIGG